MATIVGIFDRVENAERAAREIKERGYSTDEISIMVKTRMKGTVRE